MGRETGTQGVDGSRHETALAQSAMPLPGRSEDTLRARLSSARSAKSTSPNCSALKLSRFKTDSLTDLWRTVGSEAWGWCDEAAVIGAEAGSPPLFLFLELFEDFLTETAAAGAGG